MKMIILISLISATAYAQYLETNLSDSDLDPKPIVKDMGAPPKKEEQVVIMDELKREDTKKQNAGRAPAVVSEPVINESK